MVKRRTDAPAGEPPPGDPQAPAGSAPSPAEPAPGGDGGDRKKPIARFRYPTDRSTTIEVAVWENQIATQDGTLLPVHGVTIQRSYKDGEGHWQRGGSYRAHDLPALLHALQRAHAWMLDQREMNSAS